MHLLLNNQAGSRKQYASERSAGKELSQRQGGMVMVSEELRCVTVISLGPKISHLGLQRWQVTVDWLPQ